MNLHIWPPDRDKLAFITPLGIIDTKGFLLVGVMDPHSFNVKWISLSNYWSGRLAIWMTSSGGEEDNHRLYDLKLCTLLFNLMRRGFSLSASKAQVLMTQVKIVGVNANQNGKFPLISDGVFERILAQKILL